MKRAAGNLTPNPFPSGKGNRSVGSNLFASGNRIDGNARSPLLVLLPFPLGKGPGVRLSAYRSLQTGAA